ncbi:MAG: hypothetical protein KDK41_18050 [Leptospiraceae bacterium]|nr:hypothetical protein [Leptospiraceae bacterium]
MPPVPAPELYNENQPAAGTIAGLHPAERIVTRIGDGEIRFGTGVVESDDPNEVKAPASGSDVFSGVALQSAQASDLNNEKYNSLDVVGVAEAAVVTVHCEEAVDENDPVRLRHTAATGKVPGDFAKTADAGKTMLITKGARWGGTLTAAGRVALILNGPFTVEADT